MECGRFVYGSVVSYIEANCGCREAVTTELLGGLLAKLKITTPEPYNIPGLCELLRNSEADPLIRARDEGILSVIVLFLCCSGTSSVRRSHKRSIERQVARRDQRNPAAYTCGHLQLSLPRRIAADPVRGLDTKFNIMLDIALSAAPTLLRRQ